MSIFNITPEQKEQFVSEFKNPFKSDKIDRVNFFIYKNSMSANIHFEFGDTKGEQKITADDFITLVNKVQHFIENLNSCKI